MSARVNLVASFVGKETVSGNVDYYFGFSKYAVITVSQIELDAILSGD